VVLVREVDEAVEGERRRDPDDRPEQGLARRLGAIAPVEDAEVEGQDEDQGGDEPEPEDGVHGDPSWGCPVADLSRPPLRDLCRLARDGTCPGGPAIRRIWYALLLK
jgi:hypothetical protein